MQGLAKFRLAATFMIAVTLIAGSASAAGWGGRHGGAGWGRANVWHGPQLGRWGSAGSAWYLYARPSYPYFPYAQPSYPSYPYSPYLPSGGYGAPLVPSDTDTTYYPAQGYSGYGLSDGNFGGSSEPVESNDAAEPTGPQSYTRYYCASAQGYYPDVLECDRWQDVDFSPLDPDVMENIQR
jgi:hypothetical protein